MKKILFSILLLTSAVFFVSNVKADNDWSDVNFNTTTTTYGNCTANSAYDSGAVSGSNLKGLRLMSCATYWGGDHTEPNIQMPPEFSFSFYTATSTFTGDTNLAMIQIMGWTTGAGGAYIAPMIFQITGQANGLTKVSYKKYDDVSYTTYSDTITSLGWHTITYQYNQNSYSQRFKIDDGAYTTYSSMTINPTATYTGQPMTLSEVSMTGQHATKAVYVDDFDYYTYTSDATTEVIDPNYEQYSSIYVADEYFNYPKKIYCNYNATTTCSIKFNYPYGDVGKLVYLTSGENGTSTLASTTLTQITSMQKSLTLANPGYSVVQDRCLFLMSDSTTIEKKYCGIQVYWSEMNLDEALGIDPYDITTACEDVATSSGSTWDDFRYGIECGFNKSLYWLLHPSTDTVVNLVMSFDKLTDEFPLSVYKSLYTNMTNTASSTNEFELSLFVGSLNTTGSTSIVVLNQDKLSNTWSDTWDVIYAYLQVLIYAGTAIYFIHYFVSKNDSQI